VSEQFYELYHGDCLEMLSDIEDNSIDTVITDPPYGIDYTSHGGPRATDPNIAERTRIKGDSSLEEEWFQQIYRVLKNGSAAYIFCCWTQFSTLEDILKRIGFKVKTPLIWDKGNCGMGDLAGDYGCQTEIVFFVTKGRHILNGRRDRNLLSYQRPADAYRKHPMEKPVDLLRFLVEKSTESKQTVLDPFMGSGSTGIAVIQAGCSFIGIEINENYFKIAQERIEKAWLETEPEHDRAE